MKTYIFLTNTLGGYSGGPSYVRNKKVWLEKNGWHVIAFDSCGMANLEIEYPELKEYEDNRIEELFYHPSWYSNRRRERVINKLIDSIPKCYDMIVVESNILILAEWGELLSKKINAKHLIYLIGENVRIYDSNEFDFLYHKYRNNELFSISPKAFELLWGNYLKIDNPENYYWNAMSHTQPIDVRFDELDCIPKLDYTITHFGRYKTYMLNVICEICEFADNNSSKRINFILFGIKSLPENLIKRLESKNNISLYCFDSVYPIPKKIFQISDVVIATSGCATISARQDVKTISYNVETSLPIGLMKYTTIRTTYRDPILPDTNQSLNEMLEDILVKGMYNYTAPLDLIKFDKGYDYQMSYTKGERKYYNNITTINYCRGWNGKIQRCLCKLGLVHFNSLIRYYISKDK